jgi:GntP family gluconate:H+ symporter
MNDSGFWIFAKMSGLTEVEALKSWTTTLLVLAFVSLAVTMLLAFLLPDPLGFISPQVSIP